MPKKIKPLTGNFGDFSGIVLKAAANGHLDAVKHYLNFNPKWLNQVGPHGRTMLWEAAYKGRTDVVKWLIAQGADIRAIGSYYTPMHVELSALAAARHAGRDDTVELLLQHGAQDDFYAACHRGDIVAMQSFYKRKKSIVNKPSAEEPNRPRMGWHPIHYAVVGGHIEAVERLIQWGAKVAEHLPLLLDWSEINRSAIVPLLKQQAEKEAPGSTRQKNKIPGVSKVDQPNWLGYPELIDACRGNHNATDDPARVQDVLDRGANINITDYKGKTALHRAAQAGFLKITQLLIDNGAKLEFADNKQETPLFDAASYGRTETVKLLVNNGSNKEHQNYRGDTPLFAAARSKRDRAFEALLRARANREHRNKKGQLVFDILSKARHLTPERKHMLKMLDSIRPVKPPRKGK